MAPQLTQVDRLTDAQVTELCDLFQQEWWTRGRTLEETRRAVAHSPVVIGLVEPQSGRLAAFARVLTDFVFKGLILDVIVAAPYRGQSLGRALMETILQYPSLSAVKHLELYCRPELRPFYSQWGFTDDLAELHFMRVKRG
jgi:predicted GNAT family N-acyltransferase